MVRKPIVELTADVPLAVDVQAQISEGRPWFAYPEPDDFAIGNEVNYPPIGWVDEFSPPPSSCPAPDDFTAPPIASLRDCREGYPWLVPHHRVRQSAGMGHGGPALIGDLGLRWQSAIVSPNRLPWMVIPAVPPDPRFAWWTRVRDVPSDWVTNRGETERFIYYDGPTRAAVPLAVSLEAAGRLRFATPKPPHFGYGGSPHAEPQFQPEHEGLYTGTKFPLLPASEQGARETIVTRPMSGAQAIAQRSDRHDAGRVKVRASHEQHSRPAAGWLPRGAGRSAAGECEGPSPW